MHNQTHKYEKLSPIATKMVFIRYPEHFKGYVIYMEHHNGSMIVIYFHNVNFLKDEFPSIGKIKKYLKLYKLQQYLQLSLSEGKDLNSR